MGNFIKSFMIAIVSIALSVLTGCPAAIDNQKENTVSPSSSFDVVGGKGAVNGISFVMKPIQKVTDGMIGYAGLKNNEVHKVSLTAYHIGETEVTQELWQAVMGNNPSGFNGSAGKEAADKEVQGKRPVESVSWYDSLVFCNELTKKVNGGATAECVYYSDAAYTKVYTQKDADTEREPYQNLHKKGFRLPTEAEWEWAALGGQTDRWAGIDDKAQLSKYAWYDANSDGITHEVKKKLPNDYGLYDMSGNVYEMCWDVFSNSETPAGGTDPVGIAFTQDATRASRGGCIYMPDTFACCAARGDTTPNDSYEFTGFRIVCRP